MFERVYVCERCQKEFPTPEQVVEHLAHEHEWGAKHDWFTRVRPVNWETSGPSFDSADLPDRAAEIVDDIRLPDFKEWEDSGGGCSGGGGDFGGGGASGDFE